MSEASPSAVGARLYQFFRDSTVTAPRTGSPVQDAVVLPFVRKTPKPAQPAETAEAKPAAPQQKPSISMLTALNVYSMESHQREQKGHMEGKMVFRHVPALQRHFNNANNTGFGAFVGKQLVAQVLMTQNKELPVHVRENLPLSCQAGNHALIEGLLVSKEFEGRGLMKQLVQKCINDAVFSRVDHLHARVRVDNQSSLAGFKKMGFVVLGDPAPSPLHPHEQVYFLHLDLAPHREKYYGPKIEPKI